MFSVARFFLLLTVGVEVSRATFLGFVDEEVARHELDVGIPDVMIDGGETIELTCAASHAETIAWKYPRLEKNMTAVTEVSLHTTNSDGEEITPYYTSKLVITNASHADTGDYECFCSSMDDLEHLYEVHIGRKLVSKRHVYVYVKDDSKLFSGEPSTEREPVTGVALDTVILSCAVTHPEVSVQLVREKGNQRQMVIPVDGKKYQYDPRIGFIISQLSLRDSGTYACLASVNEHYVETKQFYLHVMRSQPLLQEPVLRGTSSIGLGMSTNFKCHVAAGREQLTAITWWKQVGGTEIEVEESENISIEDPLISESMCSGNRSMCSFKRQLSKRDNFQDDGQYIRFTGRMRIHEAGPAEAGRYLCKVWSGGLTLSSNVIDLQVTGPVIIVPTGDSAPATDVYNVVDYNVIDIM